MKQFIYFSVAVIIISAVAYHQIPNPQKLKYQSFEISQKYHDIKEIKSQDIPMQKGVKSAHSSSTIMLDDGSLLSVFFAGTKEGAKDVKIYANINKNDSYGDTFIMLDRQTLIKDSKEYIKKIGNPALVKIDDKIHLFVVGVSIGGWATSKIYHYISSSDKIDFKYHQALRLNPFANLSNLVRTNAINVTLDGDKKGFMLPIYHELATKYPLALVFSKDGKLLQTTQLSTIAGIFQPSAVALSDDKVLFTFRADKNVNYDLYTMLCDEFLRCQNPIKTNLKNKDNSINLFSVKRGGVFLLYNSDKDGTRTTLSLAKMEDFSHFKWLFDVDKGGEMSYASVVVDDDIAHITYTHDRKFIKYKSYNFNTQNSTTNTTEGK